MARTADICRQGLLETSLEHGHGRGVANDAEVLRPKLLDRVTNETGGTSCGQMALGAGAAGGGGGVGRIPARRSEPPP